MTYYLTTLSTTLQLRKLAYAIKNSLTVIQPQWKAIINNLVTNSSSSKKLLVCMMPHDVRTRWNSMYDMLKFASTYRDAINQLTGEWPLKLCDYELTETEWELVMHL